MRAPPTRFTVLTLGMLLAFQAAVLANRQLREAEEVPIVLGEPLPFEVSPERSLLARIPDDGCLQGFLCRTDCRYCARLAQRLAEATGRAIMGRQAQVWFLTAPPDRARSWGRAHGLSDEDVFAIGAVQPGILGRPYFGDLWFTPMRVVIGPDLAVRDSRPADRLLSPQELQFLCHNGGIAAQSLADVKPRTGRVELLPGNPIGEDQFARNPVEEVQ